MSRPEPDDMIASVGWEGASPGDECAKISAVVRGFSVSPELLEVHADGHVGLGIRRYLAGGGADFRILLYQQDKSRLIQTFEIGISQVDGDAETGRSADIGICVGDGSSMRARRRFQAVDEGTAIAFLLAMLAQLQGEGGICVDFVDMLHAWKPGVVHDLRWADGAEQVVVDRQGVIGRLPVTLFTLAGIDRYCLELVLTATRAVWPDGEIGPELLIGHVLMESGVPVRHLVVFSDGG